MEKKFLYGDRFKELRKPKNGKTLSMDELCDIFRKEYGLNVNKSMVSRWETGIAVPDNKHVVAYALFNGFNKCKKKVVQYNLFQ